MFDHRPRHMILAWRRVSGARTYAVEIECFECRDAKDWRLQRSAEDLTSTQFTFGDTRRGRWRVRAVTAIGLPGTRSEWREFGFSR